MLQSGKHSSVASSPDGAWLKAALDLSQVSPLRLDPYGEGPFSHRVWGSQDKPEAELIALQHPSQCPTLECK